MSRSQDAKRPVCKCVVYEVTDLKKFAKVYSAFAPLLASFDRYSVYGVTPRLDLRWVPPSDPPCCLVFSGWWGRPEAALLRPRT
jgi:hypothetical protein